MEIKIAGRAIGRTQPSFIIAELSANHNHDIERAKNIIDAAAEAGADAIKLQTYTPETLTYNSNDPSFQVGGTIWEGKNLYELYEEAHLPWEWHEPLLEHAKEKGLIAFSTPFDFTAIDLLESLEVPAYKVASSELVDLPLIKRISQTGKPMFISTGMGTLSEIDEAVKTARSNGCNEIILLKCTAAYPALIDEANLITLPNMSELFDVVVGLSDHTQGSTAPIVATALGGKVIEKHLTLSRNDGGPDAAFSMEPAEFSKMVSDVRAAEKSLGSIRYEPTPKELRSRDFRRSLFAVKDIIAGEKFTNQNIRSIRPANGLHTKHYEKVIRAHAKKNILAGTPLSWDLVDESIS